MRERSSGDAFCRPNYVPVMEERALLRGYADLMKWLYSPKAYYSRCTTYLGRAASIPNPRSSTLGEIAALVRTVWHVGVLSPRRRLFWPLMVKAMSRGRAHVRQAVAHAVQGEHLILYTREQVVPRMERALAEIQVGIEYGPRPRPCDLSAPRAVTALASLRRPGHVRLPVSRRTLSLPLSTLSGEKPR